MKPRNPPPPPPGPDERRGINEGRVRKKGRSPTKS